MFFCEHLLLNCVEFKVKLTQARDEFVLMYAADSNFQLHIKSTSPYVKRLRVSPVVRNTVQKIIALLVQCHGFYGLFQTKLNTHFVPIHTSST